MPPANCKKCNKVFDKVYTPYCTDCYAVHSENLSNIYRFIQENNTMSLDQVAVNCGLEPNELERILFSGELGTASSKIIYECQRCETPISPLNRRGRFCLRCTQTIEKEAKIDAESKKQRQLEKVKADHVLYEPEKEEVRSTLYPRGIEPQKESPTEVDDDESESFGFRRLN